MINDPVKNDINPAYTLTYLGKNEKSAEYIVNTALRNISAHAAMKQITTVKLLCRLTSNE